MQFLTLIDYKPTELKQTPNYAEKYDVIVAGLGTTGTEAALLCAEKGLKTLGIERMTGMGGQLTFSSMAEGTFNFDGGDAQIREKKIIEAVEEYGISTVPSRLYGYELLKEKCSLDTIYEASVIGVFIEKDKVDGVRILKYGKATDYQADMFIDCTTEAILCRMAGCTIKHGNSDGQQMAFSKTIGYMFDTQKPRGNWNTVYTMTKPTPEEYSEKVMRMSTLYPCNFKDKKKLIHQSNILGQRENGSVETLETVTFKDAVEHNEVNNPVFYTKYYCDTVRPDRDYSGEGDAYIKYRVISGLNYCFLTTGVPHGSIITKERKNLLVASKCFGISHDALSGLRFCSVLFKCAEAAAYTVYLAKKHKTLPKDIPYTELKELMLSTGAFNEQYNTGIIDVATAETAKVYSKEEVMKALKTDIVQNDGVLEAVRERKLTYKEGELVPGLAYFTMLKKKEYADYLYEEMKKSRRYAGNFAIALALADDKRCADTLLEIIKNPGSEIDPVIEKTIPNRVKAIYLLGCLGETRAIEPLLEILEDYAEKFTEDLPFYSLYNTKDDYKYLALSYTARALNTLIKLEPLKEYKERIKMWRNKPFEIYSHNAAENLSEALFRITKEV